MSKELINQQRKQAEMIKKEQIYNLLNKQRLAIEIEMKEGAYVRNFDDHKRENLGFVSFQKGFQGLDDVIWNNNRDIRLSIERDKRGPFIKMEGKINARAYLEEAKPFHELKWELEREKDLLRDIEREKERILER